MSLVKPIARAVASPVARAVGAGIGGGGNSYLSLVATASARYLFNDNLTDETGNGNNGTATGSVAYAVHGLSGIPGKALVLDSGEYITISDVFDGLSTWTIAGWVNADILGGANKSPFFGSISVSSAPTIRYGFTANRWQVYAGDGSSLYVSGVQNSSAPVISTWYHLAATYAAGVCKLYVDGTDVGTGGTVSNSSQSTSDSVRIGGGASSSAGAWDGQLADVMAFGRALSSDEIALLVAGA